MKKITLIFSSLLITIYSFAHQSARVNPDFCQADTIVPAIKDYEYYKQKSAGQKTGAWFLVAGGAICILIASGMAMNDVETNWDYLFSSEEPPNSKKREKTENILSFAGVAVLLGSIPLFIAGRRNKLKARIAMKNEKLSWLLPAGTNTYAHGITLTIPIGK